MQAHAILFLLFSAIIHARSAQLTWNNRSFDVYWAVYSHIQTNPINASVVIYNSTRVNEYYREKVVIYNASVSTFIDPIVVQLESVNALGVITQQNLGQNALYVGLKIPVFGLKSLDHVQLEDFVRIHGQACVTIPATPRADAKFIREYPTQVRAFDLLAVIIFLVTGGLTIWKIIEIHVREWQSDSNMRTHLTVFTFLKETVLRMKLGRMNMFVISIACIVRVPSTLMDALGFLTEIPPILNIWVPFYTIGNIALVAMLTVILLVWIDLASIFMKPTGFTIVKSVYGVLLFVFAVVEILHRSPFHGTSASSISKAYILSTNIFFGVLLLGYGIFSYKVSKTAFSGMFQKMKTDGSYSRFLLCVGAFIANGITYIAVNVSQAAITLAISARILFFLESLFCLIVLALLFKTPARPSRARSTTLSLSPALSRNRSSFSSTELDSPKLNGLLARMERSVRIDIAPEFLVRSTEMTLNAELMLPTESSSSNSLRNSRRVTFNTLTHEDLVADGSNGTFPIENSGRCVFLPIREILEGLRPFLSTTDAFAIIAASKAHFEASAYFSPIWIAKLRWFPGLRRSLDRDADSKSRGMSFQNAKDFVSRNAALNFFGSRIFHCNCCTDCVESHQIWDRSRPGISRDGFTFTNNFQQPRTFVFVLEGKRLHHFVRISMQSSSLEDRFAEAALVFPRNDDNDRSPVLTISSRLDCTMRFDVCLYMDLINGKGRFEGGRRANLDLSVQRWELAVLVERNVRCTIVEYSLRSPETNS